MAGLKHLLLILVNLMVLTSIFPVSLASKKPAAGARKEDIPYIKCQVCEKVAKELYKLTQAKQAEIAPKKISEYHIIEIAENVCNLKKQEADWIMKIDIVEKGDKLELVEQDTEGQCNSECKTIERACEEVLGYADTDIAEYLFTSKPSINELVNYLCKDLTNICVKKPPPVPKKPDEKKKDDDWKQKITIGIKTIGETVKGHSDKVSNRIRQWWKGVKAAKANKNTKTGKSEL